ncbi:hypothetical protein [uncultured Roseibium sp.]|uniref:hypothetical protein n=1 Tax=uncultured Roseibium sp. TaxID=1936171 RepID=UPI00261E5428|nr:hypothetical protein [uncultured Roseibium sp.]
MHNPFLIEVFMRVFLSFLALMLAGPFFFFTDGSIVKDLKLKTETLSPAYIPTENRRCRSSMFIFHHCSYNYVFQQEELDQQYFFLSFGAPETVTLMRGDSTGGITSDVGQDYLFNRIATAVALPLFALIVLIRSLVGTKSRSRTTVPPLRSPDYQVRSAAPPPTHAARRTQFGKRR